MLLDMPVSEIYALLFQDKHYLEPYLKEVIRERLEREAWNKK